MEIRLAEPVALDPSDRIRATGSFLLIDNQTGATVALHQSVVGSSPVGHIPQAPIPLRIHLA